MARKFYEEDVARTKSRFRSHPDQRCTGRVRRDSPGAENGVDGGFVVTLPATPHMWPLPASWLEGSQGYGSTQGSVGIRQAQRMGGSWLCAGTISRASVFFAANSIAGKRNH